MSREPNSSIPSGASRFSRAVRRRCPHCGGRPVFHHWLRMLPHCPTCGLRFDRGEPGYYLGAIWINLLLAEGISMAVIFSVIVRSWPTPPWDTLQWTAPLEALISPFVLFPFSKTLFLAFDLGIRPLGPKDFVA